MVKQWHRNRDVTPVKVPNLQHYRNGVPCRSTVLPKKIAEIDEIKYRYSETQLGYCFVACPTVQPIKKITDILGNVVEVVNTGEGFLSMTEGRPKLPKLVKRKTIYHEAGQPIVIECPYKNASHAPIRWQNASQMLTHVAMLEAHAGRVQIDILNRLVIDRALLSDTSAYSCWLRNEHLATIKLRVVPSFSTEHLRSKIANVGVAFTILLLFVMSLSVFRAQRKDSARFL